MWWPEAIGVHANGLFEPVHRVGSANVVMVPNGMRIFLPWQTEHTSEIVPYFDECGKYDEKFEASENHGDDFGPNGGERHLSGGDTTRKSHARDGRGHLEQRTIER